jgi:hypothetical protein
MILRYCAQDETEERILLELRRLTYSQVLAISSLVTALAEEATTSDDASRRGRSPGRSRVPRD